MTAPRRRFLQGAAGLCVAGSLSACADRGPAAGRVARAPRRLQDVAVYAPGYYPDRAYANGRRLIRNGWMARHIDNPDNYYRLLTRVGFDGDIRQTLLPVRAHQVDIAPDRSIGILCGVEARDHVAFDPQTLDLVAVAPAFGEGWRGGGHVAFLDDGATAVLSERAPRTAPGALENHFGRITIRDAASLRIRESYSTYGIDPHDIRLIDDGRYLVCANYGSLPPPGRTELALPRDVAEACVTIVDMASGQLADKIVTDRRSLELRHLAAGARDRIFAIQAALVDEEAGAAAMADVDIAYQADQSANPGTAYLPAATLKVGAGQSARPMGDPAAVPLMRHGLSIAYDEAHDQVLATYPTTHHLIVFDGASGDILEAIDTQSMGLRFPSGLSLLPDGAHYAVTGWWENLFVFERSTHRLVRDLCQYPTFFGHSHIASA